MRIVEKLVVKKLERMKENLTVHCYYRFCKKYEKFLCDENGNCVCLIPLYREVLQIVRNIHFGKKKKFYKMNVCFLHFFIVENEFR